MEESTLGTKNCTLDAAFCAANPGSKPGDYVQLLVSDNGEGIPAEAQEHIFEPIFTLKIQGKGTGLGLAMVFGFVKRSGGYIQLYSELGRGSTFRISLPRAWGQERKPQGFEAEELPKGNETILVVVDEEGMQELAQISLQALGYRVLTVSNGRGFWHSFARSLILAFYLVT